MAVRQASLRYDSIGAFLKAWNGTISQGAAFIPVGTVDGELAKEFKLDLILPVVGAIGPFNAQVIHKTPDGGIGVRLIETPTAVTGRIKEVLALVDQVEAWLIDSGKLVDPKSLPPRPVAAPVRVAAKAAVPAARGPHPGPAPGPAPRPQSAAAAAEEPAARARGLPIPEIGDRAPDFSGDMGDRSLRDGLVALSLERATGLLTIVEPGGKRRFGFWLKGGPVGWRTEPMDKEEVLGVLLFRSGNLTKEQLAQSLKVMNETGVLQGEALIDIGALTYGQLVMVLQKQAEFVLQRAMRVRDGVWGFHKLKRLPRPFVNPPLKVPSLLYRALQAHAKSMRLEELYKAQKHILDQYISINPTLLPVIEEIRFKSPEMKLLEVIQSTSWRMRELFSVSPMSRQETATAVWALNELRCLEFSDTEHLSRYLDRISSRILGKAQGLRRANHFDVLEVHWISLDDEVKAAHKKMSNEFNSSNYHDLTAELERGLAAINSAIEAAFAAVKDKIARRVYREDIVEPSMVFQSAELLAKKGEMAIMKKDYREAHLCWSKALELFPRRAEFREGYQRAEALRRGF
jgi:tetratricopeptide (TPR) repeat protein